MKTIIIVDENGFVIDFVHEDDKEVAMAAASENK